MNTSWIKDGKQIHGKYYGTPFYGIISSTRVCYGTDIQYTVQCTPPIVHNGEQRDRILVRKEKDHGNFEIFG
jgi:hypothetical protein